MFQNRKMRAARSKEPIELPAQWMKQTIPKACHCEISEH